MPDKPRMLEGYRILDFTQFVAGPTCTRVLAEMGAEVIKVELAPAGDRVRSAGLKPLSSEYKDSSQSSYYFQHNHSKLSLAVNINKPGARELLYSMIPKIDVVVENYAPGIIKKMGFGYDELRNRNPKIIMCSISALGQSGPLAYKVGYDYMGQAYAAITDGVGETDRPPAIFTMAIGDVSTGMSAAMAVGFALLHRERTGEGQYMDASILDTYFHMHEANVPMVSLRAGKYRPTRSGSQHPNGGPTGIFRYRGDQYVFLAVMPHQWPQLVRAMGKPELASDQRFRGARGRRDNNEALKGIIEEWLGGFATRDEALAALDKERVACAPVLALNEAIEHPHLRARNTVRRVKDRFLGDLDIPGVPVKFSAWPDRLDLRAALLGEDNERVLREVLEMPEDRVRALYAEGVLVRDPALESQPQMRAS